MRDRLNHSDWRQHRGLGLVRACSQASYDHHMSALEPEGQDASGCRCDRHGHPQGATEMKLGKRSDKKSLETENDRTKPTAPPEIELMRLSEVCKCLQLSRSTIWRLCRAKAGTFPRPLKL